MNCSGGNGNIGDGTVETGGNININNNLDRKGSLSDASDASTPISGHGMGPELPLSPNGGRSGNRFTNYSGDNDDTLGREHHSSVSTYNSEGKPNIDNLDRNDTLAHAFSDKDIAKKNNDQNSINMDNNNNTSNIKNDNKDSKKKGGIFKRFKPKLSDIDEKNSKYGHGQKKDKSNEKEMKNVERNPVSKINELQKRLDKNFQNKDENDSIKLLDESQTHHSVEEMYATPKVTPGGY